MTDVDHYPTPAAAEQGIKSAADRSVEIDPSLGVSERIRLEHFNRFLSRVFSEGDSSEWVLKGGTGILARVPSTRSTRDVDLYRQGFTLAAALDDLLRLAAIDLGDHFRFEYAKHTASIGNDNQPYREGYRVTFSVYIGASAREPLHVDLTVGAGPTGGISTASPVTALNLTRLISYPYRLFPIVDQVADKVCATLATYNGRPSSREKDLVDLVVFAVTQDIDGAALHVAINAESSRRGIGPHEQFTWPRLWGVGYTKLSRSVPYCEGYRTIGAAGRLVRRMVNPALSGQAQGKTWVHDRLDWI